MKYCKWRKGCPGVLLSKDVEEMKLQIHKVQCVIPEIQDEEKLLGAL